MKKLISVLAISSLMLSVKLQANEPDSAYLFAYATGRHNHTAGLHLAWSVDCKKWHPVGPEFAFVKSDYGRWGAQKKMFAPALTRDDRGAWHAVWSVNDTDKTFAYTTSKDLVSWRPQSYPIQEAGKNCLAPEISFADGRYAVSWASADGSDTTCYAVATTNFKEYTPAKEIPALVRLNLRRQAVVSGNTETGTIHKVAWSFISNLIREVEVTNYRNMLHGEMMRDDAERFAGQKSVEATITADASDSKKISDKLLGIFFEDINYAADGGIYAELVQNRGFEYQPSDRGGDERWSSRKAWSTVGRNASLGIETEAPVHENNPHYAVLKTGRTGGGLQNEGFDGIALKAGDKYDFSVFARTLEGKNGRLKIRLADESGELLGEATTTSLTGGWQKYTAVITAKSSAAKARLEIIPQTEGTVGLDMVSLFPQKTFKGRKNGLRSDLAQALADMKPRFVRFPGGCVAHGDGIENIYRWKNTIGPPEARKPQRNLWGYHQTAGLGYFEYFLFCEDIGAAPLPIVAAGVPCQNSAKHNHPVGGQQGGIPMCEMGDYIQDIFDLIEWANGNPKASKWAKMRADAGHPAPFNLKYLGVGNEDLISDVFEERFTMIYEAVKEKYPEIVVIGTAGPFWEGSDYVAGWVLGAKLGVPMLDEHYYNPPGWYIHNQQYYDRYDRSKPSVYLGEYAAHLPNRSNNIETMLAEALHLINVERNGDIVSMTSYAPLLAKEGFTQWNPNLIYFNNSEVKPTVGYHMQKLFGVNAGDEYIASRIKLSDEKDAVAKRVASSVVRDSKTGDIIIKLANLLPVEVKANLDLSSLNLPTTEVIRNVLAGRPDDKAAKPVESITTISGIKESTLPAYSLTVLRIR
ncbi:MAG: carbohydrate binding domain-containing protein [Prevotellaceae bacterium]|jgi:alpha-L-arabinofuranosidase|nr:carbohydrate binding domain-containing protein [Prevotellaceae bacterium]